MIKKQAVVGQDLIYPKENLNNESYLNPPVTTNFLKEKRPEVKDAYRFGYEAGLSNHIGAGENFNLDLTEKLSLAWLDGWLDGVEATEKQCTEMLGSFKTANNGVQL